MPLADRSSEMRQERSSTRAPQVDIPSLLRTDAGTLIAVPVRNPNDAWLPLAADAATEASLSKLPPCRPSHWAGDYLWSTIQSRTSTSTGCSISAMAATMGV